MHYPTDRITHTTAFVTPVVEHWLEREIAQWDNSIAARSYLCYFSEEPAKVGTCARDRRALQQLALNVHVKHSDLA